MTERAGGPFDLSLEEFDRLVRVPEEVREEWVPVVPPVVPDPATPWLAAGGGGGADTGGCDGD